MDRFPPWLPMEVKKHAEYLITVGCLNTAKPLLMRLVTHYEMEKVWNRLTRNSKQAQQLIDFLEYVRLHASLQGEVTSSISIPSDKVQRAAFHKITNAAETILPTLATKPVVIVVVGAGGEARSRVASLRCSEAAAGSLTR